MPERGLKEKMPVLAAGSLSGLPSRLGVSCKTRVISEEKVGMLTAGIVISKKIYLTGYNVTLSMVGFCSTIANWTSRGAKPSAKTSIV